jgi:hypothetical protein
VPSLPALRRIPRDARSLACSGSVLRQNSPENFIKTNPQTNTAVYETNLGHANYHSLQTQLSVRPIYGVSTQVTYTWSRNLGQVPGEGPNGYRRVSLRIPPIGPPTTRFWPIIVRIPSSITAPSSCRSGPTNSCSRTPLGSGRGWRKTGKRVGF